MAKNQESLKINVANDTYVLEDLLKTLINIPAVDVNNLFVELNITFGRELRISVLRETFRESVILTRKERNTLADEMNYRLSWFNQYTETQLINLFNFYKNQKLEEEYLNDLWYKLILELGNKNITDDDFKRLLSLSDAKKAKEDIVKYNNNLNDIFFDEPGKLDGLTPEQLRPVLYKSSTIVEIREIGKKYQVNVPSRLRKAELLAIIISELKDAGKYSEELEENLSQLNILLLQRFAKDNNIKASTELKKEEVIEYVLSNAKQTKESYYVPTTKEYELEAHDLGEVLEEDITPVLEEEVIEEVKEEVVTEPVKEVVTERIVEVHRESAPVVNEFDPSTVEGAILNTVTFGSVKPKQFVEIASVERGFYEEEKEVINPVQKVEIINKKRRGGASVIKKIFLAIFIILFIAVTLAVILGLYVLFTPNGAPAAWLQTVEDTILKVIPYDFFSKIRDFVSDFLKDLPF